jgi:hypothetical protein
MIMKAILSALVALSVLAGASLSAVAAEEEYDFPSNTFDNIQRHLP